MVGENPQWPLDSPPNDARIVTNNYSDPFNAGKPTTVYEFIDSETGEVRLCIRGGDNMLYSFDAIYLSDQPEYQKVTRDLVEQRFAHEYP